MPRGLLVKTAHALLVFQHTAWAKDRKSLRAPYVLQHFPSSSFQRERRENSKAKAAGKVTAHEVLPQRKVTWVIATAYRESKCNCEEPTVITPCLSLHVHHFYHNFRFMCLKKVADLTNCRHWRRRIKAIVHLHMARNAIDRGDANPVLLVGIQNLYTLGW